LGFLGLVLIVEVVADAIVVFGEPFFGFEGGDTTRSYYIVSA
jgi:hypothetical protein